MKRFYCTVCKKMKRTRQWPIVIENVNDVAPQNRVGACNRHTMSRVSHSIRRNVVKVKHAS